MVNEIDKIVEEIESLIEKTESDNSKDFYKNEGEVLSKLEKETRKLKKKLAQKIKLNEDNKENKIEIMNIQEKVSIEGMTPLIKEPRSIDEQIKHLSKPYCKNEAKKEDSEEIRPSHLGKSIKFNGKERKEAKFFLSLNSYDNTITPLKPIISTGYKRGNSRAWHEYEEFTNWKEIRIINEKINGIESRLLHSILAFEKLLKSTLTETIKEIIKNSDNGIKSFNVFLDELEISVPKSKKSSKELKEDLKEEFAKTEQNMKKESGYERSWKDVWWYHIKALTVAKLNTLLNSKYKGQTLYEFNSYKLKATLNKLGNGVSSYWLQYENKENPKERADKIFELLENFRILRNSLCHNIPLIIFLDRPLKNENLRNYNNRKSIIKAIKKFNNKKFKENPITVNDQGIILDYESYRNTGKYRVVKNTYENPEDMI